MIPENDPIRRALNVDTWHKKGFKGQGVNVGTFEGVSSGHGYQTAFAFKEIAPKANLIEIDTADPYSFILEKKISIAFRSLEHDGPVAENMKFPEEIKKHCILLTAADNQGIYVTDTLMDRPEWYGIGAVTTDFFSVGYSNRSDHILCAAPCTVYYKDKYGCTQPDTGTSYSNPFVAGMFAIINSSAKRPLTAYEWEKLIPDFCVNPYNIAKNRVGHGIFVLPDTLNLSKYMENNMEDKPYIGLPDVKDYGDHSEWATEAVKYVVDNKIMHGDGNGNFRWHDPITREEVAQIIFNMK